MFSPKRDIGTLVWDDPLAWTEQMKGAEWKSLIAKESKLFQTVLQKTVRPLTIQTIQDELYLAEEADHMHPYLVEDSVFVWLSGMTSLEWKWNSSTANQVSANDLAVDAKGNIWQVYDTGSGAESYTLFHHTFNQEKPSWSIPTVGPFVIVIDSLCYFLEAKNKLWYYRLSCVNAYTGKGYKVLYEETDPQWNLSLQRGENHTAYLVRENSGLQEAFFFFHETLKKLPISGFFVLAGGAPNDYFATPGRGTDEWKGYGPRLSRWILPPQDKGIPEDVWVHQSLLVTRHKGQRFLWKCSTQEQPVLLAGGNLKFKLNSFGIHHQDRTASFISMTPGAFSTYYDFTKGKLHTVPPLLPAYGHVDHFLADKSVPYFLVTPMHTQRPSHLLVVGYGAYGLSTPVSTSRWYPLLLRGWAVAIALVRGGGDDTMAWANAARTYKREASLQDFEAVIKAAQKKLRLDASKTVIYGRSAGGILVGGAAARQKQTSFFKALYAEVPYLDLLRTTTNPKLPLTQLEYDEFGNPASRIEDLMTLAKVSPIDQIPSTGYPGLFALLRTGQNDSEVYAYESVKWILRARGKQKSDSTKLLAFEPREGHFVGGASGLRNRAIDLSLLLAWSQGTSFKI